MAQLVKNPPAMRERPGFHPWVGKIPWRRERLPSPVFICTFLINSDVEHLELYSMLCGDLNGKETPKRGDICMHMADSLHSIAETDTILQSNYTPIKIVRKIL